MILLDNGLSAWQTRLAAGYEKPIRWASPRALWMRVVDSAGQVAKPWRTNELSKLKSQPALADCMAGLCFFATKLGFDLDRITWEKFPDICPYCLPARMTPKLAKRISKATQGQAIQSCRCSGGKARPYDPSGALIEQMRCHEQLHPSTIEQWQQVFDGIYGLRHRDVGVALGYHLVEEIGEVAREIQGQDFVACQAEVADVLSWIFSLANSAARTMNRPVSVQKALGTYYSGPCRSCSQVACICRW
jgi:NTP pyrophosphatase (non-canonical NTP hydrolase)